MYTRDDLWQSYREGVECGYLGDSMKLSDQIHTFDAWLSALDKDRGHA